MKIEDFKKKVGTNKDIFLMDLSWNLYRSYYSFGNLTATLPNGVTKPMGHIFGVLRTVMQLKQSYPKSVIVLCVDGYPIERKQLLESIGVGYKDGREKKEYDIYQDVNLILDLCYLTPGVCSAYHKHQESDDLMYAMAKELKEGNRVHIFSGDDDLLQAIEDNICVVRKLENNKPIRIDEEFIKTDARMVTKYRGCSPKHLPIYRAIIGDKSDSIPGIQRMPKQLAMEIATKADGDITKLKNCSELIKGLNVTSSQLKYINEIRQNYDRIELNYRIMKLNKDIDYDIHRRKLNMDKEMEELNINSYKNFLYRFK